MKNKDINIRIENYILNCLDNMSKFFDEVCYYGFKEDADRAEWDYDGYFMKQAKIEIEDYTNPLGLSPFI